MFTKPIGPFSTLLQMLGELVIIFFGVPLNPLLFLGVPFGLPLHLVGVFSILSVGPGFDSTSPFITTYNEVS